MSLRCSCSQSHRVPRSTYEHGEIAANLLAGRGFANRFLGADGPTSQQAPIYPALLAAAYAIGGVETPRSLLLFELGQSVLGGILVLGVLRLAASIVGNRPLATLAAGSIAALHPTLVYAATHVQVALLGATLLTWTLYYANRTGTSGRPLQAILTGILLALLALTDPILSLALAGVVWAIVLGAIATCPRANPRGPTLGASCSDSGGRSVALDRPKRPRPR